MNDPCQIPVKSKPTVTNGRKPRAWLLSAYHTDSHRQWADWLSTAIDDFDWETFTLPGRHFRWRIRGNPLSWLDQFPKQTPQLIVATSMVDLSTLLSLQPHLHKARLLYYFHENQFAYPLSDQQHASIDPQMVQLYGALAADQIVFNSAYNRDSFLRGIEQLFRRLPDQLPDGISGRLRAKSQVLPVPIQPISCSSQSMETTKRCKNDGLILWNHRWEYDKQPEVFAEALNQLAERGVAFKLALLGARPQKEHPALQLIRKHHAQRIAIDDYPDQAIYQHWLEQADIVVSTAAHEFQGLAMLEACSAGAIPLVPDHLCYPEIYPRPYRYPANEPSALVEKLQSYLQGDSPAPFDIHAFTPEHLGPRWRELLIRQQKAR